ncbi:MAG: CoA transferase [Pseudomonadales bacterium]
MGVLEQLRVLDLTDVSGVFGTRLLADLGADVIRVEAADGGSLRQSGPFIDGNFGVELGYYHQYHNANKRSVVLDLEDAEGIKSLHQILTTTHVLVESGQPGHLDRFGLGYQQLAERYPWLVYVSVSPFGQDGPWSTRHGNDLIAAATGGILGVSGSPDEPPMQGNGDPSYKMAGLLAATGAMVAWYGAQGSGTGRWVDISVQEATTMLVVQSMNPCIYTRENRVPQRRGFMGPIHRCADGRYMAARATPNSVHRLESYAREHGFEPGSSEGAPGADIMAQIARVSSAREVMALVESLDLIGLPVGRFEDMTQTEHFIATRQFSEVRSSALGRNLSFVRSPVAGVRGDQRIRPAPQLGEHSREVMEEAREHVIQGPQSHDDTSDLSNPLSGIRVLDFTWVLAGPLGTRILANFGAEVIRIESSVRPDTVRHSGPTANTSGMFNDANAGKKSVSLDLTRAEAIDIVKRMVADADVVTNNFRAGVLDRMGLGYETLKSINPRIVFAHLPGCGNEGPWANRGTFGGILMAASGFNEISGFEGSPPWGICCAYPDFTSPYLLAMQVLAAVYKSRQTGVGQEIVIDQLSAMISLLGVEWMRFGLEGVVPRNANRNFNYCPHGVYPVAGEDRWCAIVVDDDAKWQILCQAMGKPEMAEDPRFANHESRKLHEDELDAIIAQWTMAQDGWQLADELQSMGIAAALVEMLDDMIERDPQLAHRHHYQQVVQPTDPDITLTLDREAIHFVGMDRKIERAPTLGEHNHEVLRAHPLNFSSVEIENLIESGVLR